MTTIGRATKSVNSLLNNAANMPNIFCSFLPSIVPIRIRRSARRPPIPNSNLFSLALITKSRVRPSSTTSTIWQTPNWRPLSQIFFAGHARSTCADLDEVARAARPLSAAGSYGRAESDFNLKFLSYHHKEGGRRGSWESVHVRPLLHNIC